MTKAILFCCCPLPLLLFGAIVESNHLADLQAYTDAHTMIICDVDNTLIESTLQMGSAQWREYIRKRARGAGYSVDGAEAVLDAFWICAQFFVPVRCVDPSTPQVLLELKHSESIVIALTAREPIEVSHTQRQLSSVGIDLRNIHDREDSFSLPLPYPCIYEKGVVYSGENTKSAALLAFFQKTDHLPNRIVFIDDRLEQLQAMESSLKISGINFIGIRFARADARVKDFNPEIAELQWSRLPEIISDEEALRILAGNKVSYERERRPERPQ
jgi:hypothetical protein